MLYISIYIDSLISSLMKRLLIAGALGLPGVTAAARAVVASLRGVGGGSGRGGGEGGTGALAGLDLDDGFGGALNNDFSDGLRGALLDDGVLLPGVAAAACGVSQGTDVSRKGIDTGWKGRTCTYTNGCSRPGRGRRGRPRRWRGEARRDAGEPGRQGRGRQERRERGTSSWVDVTVM